MAPRAALRAAAVALAAATAACFSTTPPDAPCSASDQCPRTQHCDTAAGVCRDGVGVTVTPAIVTLLSGAKQTFLGAVAGSDNKAVTWSLATPADGAVTADGVYTAPVVAGTRNLTLTVTAVADTRKTATAAITVNPITVVLGPIPASVNVGRKLQLSTNTPVSWTVQEGSAGGSIDASGLYTAPASPGVYHAVGTSTIDANMSAQLPISVLPPVAVTLSPAAPAVAARGSITLTAAVSNATNTAVNWSVQEGAAGGSITAAGVYTAPNAGGTFHVTAVSQADTSASATVAVVVAPPVAVTISPGSAAVPVNGSQTFTAAVANSPNQAVTWKVSEANGGSITAGGVYTAPAATGTFHVTATAAADPLAVGAATAFVVAGQPSASTSTIAVAPGGSAPPIGDGRDSFKVTVTAKDSTGNPVPGAAVGLASAPGSFFYSAGGSYQPGTVTGRTGANLFTGVAGASGVFTATLYGYGAVAAAPAAFLCLAAPCPAGTQSIAAAATFAAGAWQPVTAGLSGADANAIALDPANPSVVYLGTTTGLYKSADKGLTWSFAGLANLRITSVAAAAGTPPVIYATTDNNGRRGLNPSPLFSSTDAGATWNIQPGPDGESLQHLAADPAHPGAVLGAGFSGAWRTTDGATWSKTTPAPAAGRRLQVLMTLFDPSAAGVVWAAASDIGPSDQVVRVLKSTDSGASFADVGAHLAGGGNLCSAGYPYLSSRALALDASAAPRAFYLACPSNPGTVFKSTDAVTWAPLASLPIWPMLLAVPPGGGVLYAAGYPVSVYKTTDGTAWTQVPCPGDTNAGLISGAVFDPADATKLVLSVRANDGNGSSGVLRSDASGSLVRSNQGLAAPTLQPTAWASDPVTSSLYLYAERQPLRSTDNGATWGMAATILSDTLVWNLSIDAAGTAPGKPGLYARSNRGLFKLPGGATSPNPLSYPGSNSLDVIADPVTSNTVYVLDNTSNTVRVYRSADGGATWANPVALSGAPSNLAFRAARVSATVSAIFAYGLGSPVPIYRSTDGGSTFPLVFTQPNYVDDFRPDPGNGNVAWIVSNGALLKLTIGGTTGTQTAAIPAGVYPLWVGVDGSTSPGTLWLLASEADVSAVFKSADGGATWSRVSAGISGYNYAGSAFLFGTSPGVVLLSNVGGGVMRTTTGGQ